MLNAIYTVIIGPLVQMIDVCYEVVFRIFKNPGIAICGVSFAVTLCTLPLYLRAEQWQHLERNTAKRLKPKIERINASFRGDERYFILATYYKQNHYHPVYALRNSLGVLFQIPFFIAAYRYLSHLSALQGVPFLYIADLGAPDALLAIGVHHVNVLPIAMTFINCVSGAIYTKGFALRDKLQLYGMALVFLVLLYQSPAALVLYWTMNNVFSLIKNILLKCKHPLRIAYVALCVGVLLLDGYVLFANHGSLLKRIVVATAMFMLLFTPLCVRLVKNLLHIVQSRSLIDVMQATRLFACSAFMLFVLVGFVIPSTLIASSVREFSFIESYTSPMPFVYNTVLQAAGIFLFWATLLFVLFSVRVKVTLALGMTLCAGIALVNTFLFPGNYGFMTLMLTLSDEAALNHDIHALALNAGSLCAVVLVLGSLVFWHNKTIIYAFQLIMLVSLIGLGVTNTATIRREYASYAVEKQTEIEYTASVPPITTLSQNGKNVIVIMLDRAIAGYVPALFDENPQLFSEFAGFTWYKNTISFGGFTLIGAPSLFGGYEYSPLEINKRDTQPLLEKHGEALQLLPRLFLDEHYAVTVIDPEQLGDGSYLGPHLFDAYPNIHAMKITGNYTPYWIRNHLDLNIVSVSKLLSHNLIIFSLFKCAPIIGRNLIYNNGNWFTKISFDNIPGNASDQLTLGAVNNYATLDLLPQITTITADAVNTYTSIVNELTHEPVFLQAPDYIPASTVTNRGTSPFRDETHYHATAAALLRLGTWFDFLKENHVYDNTRIIIVSDHGADLRSPFPNNIILPNAKSLETYAALLLVKDFDSSGVLAVDHTFMTNADVPLLATDSLIAKPLNPFTGQPLQSNKAEGITLTTTSLWESHKHGKYRLTIGNDEWMHVHDDIYNSANWSAVTVEP